jgi:hypothetical protein
LQKQNKGLRSIKMRRYNRDQRISGGKLQSAQAVSRIRRARDFGLLPTKEVILQSSQRLDHLAHEYLGDSKLWWVLAALSDIGWAMQLPPGTIVLIPIDMGPIKSIVG